VEALLEQVRAELRGRLLCQPHCSAHPEFACLRMLTGEPHNEILKV